MNIWVEIFLMILGLGLVVAGADILVDGATSIARKFGISEFVIGITIVGFGTSCPELVVSVAGAIAGNPDISIGNVLGSNIFNTLLILGLTAVLSPIVITEPNRRRDIPICLATSILFVLFSLDGRISTVDAAMMIGAFAIYLYSNFRLGQGQSSEDASVSEDGRVLKAVIFIVVGLAFLIKGGDLFVDKAQIIARAAGVSDKFIAITLLAGGTSLPELATCIVAAAKGKGQLALGNILGSNVFNLFFIVGIAGVISPLSTIGMDVFDWGVLVASISLLLLFTYTGSKNKISRFEGVMLLAAEAIYMSHLIIVS